MADLILTERDGEHIVTVTLNRPEKLNALTRAMWRELGATVARLGTDPSVRCIVLRGGGDVFAGAVLRRNCCSSLRFFSSVSLPS